MVAHLQTVQMDALFLSCMCKCVHQSTYTAARLTLARFGRGEGEHGGQNESSIEANTSTALENNCQHTFCLLSFNLIKKHRLQRLIISSGTVNDVSDTRRRNSSYFITDFNLFYI